MKKRKWIAIIIFLLLVAGWYRLFYKTWSNESVTKNTDCIITLDVKRITNTFIWNYIIHPSKWKSSNWFSSSEDGKVSWDEMISLPDYVFIFHRKGEPKNAFYTVLEINNEDDFKKGLQQYKFEKSSSGVWTSSLAGLAFVQNGNKLVIGNAAVVDMKYIQQVAEELFVQKQFADKPLMETMVASNTHIACKGSLYSNISYDIYGSFDDALIAFTMPLTYFKGPLFPDSELSVSDSSMLTLHCMQPLQSVKSLFSDSSRQVISKAVNFNIDSLLLPSNKHYQLDIQGIYSRKDSAISYTYDDNFNPVEKVVLNNVEEPAFCFTVTGNEVANVYGYFKRNGKIEMSKDTNLFTPVPFVKSYCSITSSNTLMIASARLQRPEKFRTIRNGFFLKVLLEKVPATLLRYLSPALQKTLQNVSTVEAFTSNEKGLTVLHVQFKKKQNDQPLVEF